MASEMLSDKEKEVLELEARRKVFNLVNKHAGAHFRDIERKSKLSTGSAQYHLDYLTRKGLINLRKEGNLARYYPRSFKTENQKIMSFLRQKSVRDILLFILTHSNCNHEQIVQSVSLSPSTVSWHLKKLQEGNVIESVKKGRKTNYKLVVDKNEIMDLLITYQESFLDSIVNNIVEMWE